MRYAFARLCILGLIALTAASCASDAQYVSRSLLDHPPERMGAVFGSIGLAKNEGGKGRRYTLIARHVASGEQIRFSFARNDLFDTPDDFEDARAEIAVFATPLPEGQYEIHNFEFASQGLGGAENRISAREDFSLPFEVREGQATYLGEFVAVPVLGKRFLGAIVVTRIYWEIDDRRIRDLPVARQRLPMAGFDRIIPAVPDAEKIGLPFFVPAGGPVPERSAQAR